ncbi:dihydroxyacetone kinase [Bisporella sp. PMI_857]|nr:dihydroxyacetone kinase [Bisporella sp. PMI_857]KAH8600247.1 dihydroxyacetone kinase [Bisporella sp. PMI_857]
MSAKHFINDPTFLVNSALHALTITNPSVALDPENKIVYRRPGHKPQVSIISGGGSGHEPSFGGFVGDGLLSAAVAGSIFASPSAEQIRRAIMARVDTEQGILVTVMNYTGKGFGLEGRNACGCDDVGVGRAQAGKVGRRGIAGTVLVHKITGALAASGASLEDVFKVGKLTANNIVSVGASLDHVHVPGRKFSDINPDDKLAHGEVEIGMGIHNEKGSGREKVDLPGLVKKLLGQLLDQEDKDRAFLKVNSNEVVLLINNLGGVSVIELGGITAEVVKQLENYNIKPVRILAGTYMTSLDGKGFSISLLNVVNTDIGGPSMVELLDASCEAVGSTDVREDTLVSTAEPEASGLKYNTATFKSALSAGLKRFDEAVGDGDCAVLGLVMNSQLSGDTVLDLSKIVHIVETTMDGTSGALYAIFLNSLVHALRNQASGVGEATPKVWSIALKQASEALSKYTQHNQTGDLKKAAESARNGAVGTKGMKASLGRSVYVGGSGYEEVPDPGAWGLSEFLLGLALISEDTDYEIV